MVDFFQSPKRRRVSWPVVVAGLVITLFVFLLIPLTHIEDLDEAEEAVESIGIYMLPPPPPPPEQPPPLKEVPDPEPELEPLPAMPPLEQLEVSLQPGTGGVLAVGSGLDLNFEVESGRALLDLFDFAELDEIPHITRTGRVSYPADLRRAGVEGYVRLLVIIEKDGSVAVQEVLDFSDAAFVAPAVRGAEASRFTSPQRGGEAVRARYTWMIEFTLDG